MSDSDQKPASDDASGSVNDDLLEQVAKLTDVAARAQADLQNYKDRMKREGEELRKFAIVPLVMELLSVRDDLARAADHDGYAQILTKLDKVLADTGVEKIEAIGKKVDPALHEVINTGPGEKDVILAVHQDGFLLHGKILRPSKIQAGEGEI